MSFSIVVAADAQRGIGQGGLIPWRLPEDMAYFKRVTSQASAGRRNAVIMGRKTYESIPSRFRPLPGRLNIVLTRGATFQHPEDVLVASSLPSALELAHAQGVEAIFVVGGGDVYTQALVHPECEYVHITRVRASHPCDAHLAAFESDYRLVSTEGPLREDDVEYAFEVYQRIHP